MQICNYCLLVWRFSTGKSVRKIEKVQKGCFGIVFGDYENDYDTLHRKTGKLKLEIKRLRALTIEIFKIVNNLTPNCMKDTFTPKLHAKLRPNDILIKDHNNITYGAKSLKTLSLKMWNQLPGKIKSKTCYTKLEVG